MASTGRALAGVGQSPSEAEVAVGTLLLTPASPAAVAASAPSRAGTIAEADLGPEGLAVRLLGSVPPHVADVLHGERVWVTARLDDGRLLVYRSLARRDPRRRNLLDLTGIAAPHVEHRRALVRAASRLPGRLAVRAGTRGPVPVETLDVSSGGCRLQLPREADAPPVGAEVEVSVDLPDAQVGAVGVVLRTDPARGQVVVRFRAIDVADAELLHRHVLAALEDRAT